MVTVYSNPNCVQCEQTKRWLSINSIPFESKMIADSPEIYELIETKGYKSAPVVVSGKDSWSGFKLDKLATLI